MPILPIRVTKQLKTHWCWLATGCAIVKFYNRDFRKTQQDVMIWLLNDRRDEVLLKKFRSQGTVNFPASVSSILEPLGMLERTERIETDFEDVHALQEYGALMCQRIEAAIDAGRPIAMSIKLRGSDAEGHYLIIMGYTEHDILWMDPAKQTLDYRRTPKDEFMWNIGELAVPRYLAFTQPPPPVLIA